MSKPIKHQPGMTPPKDYKFNQLSGNWIFCPDPKVINPMTGRCVKPDSRTIGSSSKSKTSKMPTTSTTSTTLTIPASTKKQLKPMQKIVRDYMVEISKINASQNKPTSLQNKKSSSKSKKMRAKSM